MEVSFVGCAPSSKSLVREGFGAGDGAEEVHAPFGRLGVINIPQSKWYGDVGEPGAGLAIRDGRGGEPITKRVRDEKVIEWSTLFADFGWVVDEGLVGNVVGVDFELQVVGWVVFTTVDEGFHDIVLPDIVIDALVGVEVEMFLLEGLEVHVYGSLIVAEVDLGAREGIAFGHGLVELGRGGFWAAGDLKGWPLGASGLGYGSRSCEETAGGDVIETHLLLFRELSGRIGQRTPGKGQPNVRGNKQTV